MYHGTDYEWSINSLAVGEIKFLKASPDPPCHIVFSRTQQFASLKPDRERVSLVCQNSHRKHVISGMMNHRFWHIRYPFQRGTSHHFLFFFFISSFSLYSFGWKQDTVFFTAFKERKLYKGVTHCGSLYSMSARVNTK